MGALGQFIDDLKEEVENLKKENEKLKDDYEFLDMQYQALCSRIKDQAVEGVNEKDEDFLTTYNKNRDFWN